MPGGKKSYCKQMNTPVFIMYGVMPLVMLSCLLTIIFNQIGWLNYLPCTKQVTSESFCAHFSPIGTFSLGKATPMNISHLSYTSCDVRVTFPNPEQIHVYEAEVLWECLKPFHHCDISTTWLESRPP